MNSIALLELPVLKVAGRLKTRLGKSIMLKFFWMPVKKPE